jgi:hypothetical protein
MQLLLIFVEDFMQIDGAIGRPLIAACTVPIFGAISQDGGRSRDRRSFTSTIFSARARASTCST